MTEIKAILRMRSGSYSDFYNANLVYALGEHAHITSGENSGRWKVGDGVTAWRNLPFSPRTAALNAPGLTAGSSAQFFGKINPDGTFTLNGIAEAVERIDAKDSAQDAELGLHGGRIADIETTVAGMSGAVIYIGKVDRFTGELEAMSETDRDALLTARAVEIRGHVQDGYTLEDKGLADVAGRFHYWQYQPDGTWFDRGERGDVSVATNADYGLVKGSALDYEVSVKADGTMEVNSLAAKLAALDTKNEGQDGRLNGIEEEFGGFKDAQEETNTGVSEILAELAELADGAKTRLTAVENKNTEQDTAITAEEERAKKAEGERISKSIFSNTNAALVADMAVMPEAGSLANIRKSLKNVDKGDNYDIDVHVKSVGKTLASQFTKTDEHNYTLNLEVKDVSVTDGEADGSLIGVAAKTLAAWFQGIRNNLKSLFESKTDKLTGATECDRVYVKHADGTQGYQELWAEPVANAIPSRDDDGVLYAKAGGGGNAVVVKSQMDEAIAAAAAEMETADTGPIEAALPPFFTDRDGRFVAGRGGTLIELNVTEQAA